MATQPQPDQNQRRAAIASAVALLAAGMTLPQIVALAGVRPGRIRQVIPTEALRSTMAAPYFVIARAWAAERPALMAAYTAARASGQADIITAAIEQATARVAANTAPALQQATTALRSLNDWHAGQWGQRIRSATRIDVRSVMRATNTAPEIGNAQAWARQLLADMVQQTGHGIGNALQGALSANAPVSDAGAAVSDRLANARKRAASIGVDQTERVSRSLDRVRRRAVGLTKFRWHHSPHVRHPRPEHVARDGRVYSESNAPNDRAGTLPFCQCWEEGLFQ